MFFFFINYGCKFESLPLEFLLNTKNDCSYPAGLMLNISDDPLNWFAVPFPTLLLLPLDIYELIKTLLALVAS
jgi:hypothetical protein